MEFRRRFDIPIPESRVAEAPFYRPPDDSIEMQYLMERRRVMGGPVPKRTCRVESVRPPQDVLFDEFYRGTEGREVSSTMAFVRILSKLLKDPVWGKLIVPIVPDEARTFGMEALFRVCGIYSHVGQLYEPVDKENLLYYREAQDGQILEEGITEAGSMCSFIAAGSAYANQAVNTIPFFIYYSMFGMQRVGDLVWAAGDMRCRGFLIGGTAGRTTLAGEGLQHQDGQSHLLAYPVPNLLCYDPAYAYEIAVIIQEGIRRMYQEQESVFYYFTAGNENYAMPRMPDGCREGILKGLYLFRPAFSGGRELKVQLLGSGSILNETLKAQELLEREYGVAADVWSATSYKELRRDALACQRRAMLNPQQPPPAPYVTRCLADTVGPIVAASDYVKMLPDSVARWMPRAFSSLGTEGFGRSDNRRALRDFFEVDHRYIALAALKALADERKVALEKVIQAVKDLDINPDKLDPWSA